MSDIPLSIPLFLPLAAALLGLLVPSAARWLVTGAAVLVLAWFAGVVVDFDAGGGLHYVTDETWIEELGIHYALGVDGLNIFLVGLTALLWVASAVWAAARDWERPHLFFFHLGLAETAVLGAFLAQDLALFVVFFDLMLVPFYFLVGMWGEGDRVRATTKLVIYTLVGSLLMLAGAVALGVLSTPDGGEISFLLSDLEQRTLPAGTQYWIFCLFAIAFLVKAPAFPVHGWMPDAYRATPLPVLVLLSAVLSKVGVYAFLKIVLPVLPEAAHHFQEILIAIAVVSILYGSALAFSQDEARLVVGYSSIAQLGFIVLGIFSPDEKGAQGGLMQMVNHGLVAGALFFIIAVLSRSAGSELLSRMGGIAMRAPVLAAIFLIVALATLAMPGSPNFVGEILILFGAFEQKLAWGIVASIGVVLASVYMIRMLQKAVHNRLGEGVAPREIDALGLAVLAPLTLVILALAVYPNFILERTEPTTEAKTAEARALAVPPAADPNAGAVPKGRPFLTDEERTGAAGSPQEVQTP